MIFSFGTGDAFSKLALEKWTALGTEDNDDDGDDDGDKDTHNNSIHHTVIP